MRAGAQVLALLCPSLTCAAPPGGPTTYTTATGGYVTGQWKISDGATERRRVQGGALSLSQAYGRWRVRLGGRQLTEEVTERRDPVVVVGEEAAAPEPTPGVGRRDVSWTWSAMGGIHFEHLAIELGAQYTAEVLPGGGARSRHLWPAGRLRAGPESFHLDFASGDWSSRAPVPGQHRLGLAADVGPGRVWGGLVADQPRALGAALAGAVPLGGALGFGVGGVVSPGDTGEILLLQVQLTGRWGW